MLAGTSSVASAGDVAPGLDASLPAAAAMVGSWVPWSTRGVKVLTAAELTAHGAELANGASGSRVCDCWRETLGEWAWRSGCSWPTAWWTCVSRSSGNSDGNAATAAGSGRGYRPAGWQ
jgi:hypothetical protein